MCELTLGVRDDRGGKIKREYFDAVSKACYEVLERISELTGLNLIDGKVNFISENNNDPVQGFVFEFSCHNSRYEHSVSGIRIIGYKSIGSKGLIPTNAELVVALEKNLVIN